MYKEVSKGSWLNDEENDLKTWNVNAIPNPHSKVQHLAPNFSSDRRYIKKRKKVISFLFGLRGLQHIYIYIVK